MAHIGNMTHIRNIVVISKNDESGAILHTQIDHVKFSKPAAMAIRNICYGELYNIHEGNNNIYLSCYDLNIQQISTKLVRITPGRYDDRVAVLEAIDYSIQETLLSHYADEYESTLIQFNFQREAKQKKVVTVKQRKVFITDMGRADTPWSLLGIDDFQNPVVNATFESGTEIAFLYSNVVENSYINNKKSRILAVIPLEIVRSGYKFLEFSNPIYVPIEIKEFNSILLEIRDMHGKLIPFNPEYKTVISLHIKTAS